MFAPPTTSGRAERFDANVFELNGHRFAGVELQREDAGGEPLAFGLVDHADGLHAVDEMLQAVALGDDDVFVPVVRLDLGLDVRGLAELAGDGLLAIGSPGDQFAALGHDAASARAARFVVEDSGEAGCRLRSRPDSRRRQSCPGPCCDTARPSWRSRESLSAAIRYENRSSKSSTIRFLSPDLAMRKLFPFAGFSLVVLPVIAPSCTDQCPGRPAQPVRSWPLKSFLNPGSGTKTFGVRPATSASTISFASAGKATFVVPMPVKAVVVVRICLSMLSPNSRVALTWTAYWLSTPSLIVNVSVPFTSRTTGAWKPRPPRPPRPSRAALAAATSLAGIAATAALAASPPRPRPRPPRPCGAPAFSSSVAASAVNSAVTVSPSCLKFAALPRRSTISASGILKSAAR